MTSKLLQMTQTTPTQFWNDSCSIPELQYALEHGGVGATTNPVIVGQVLNNEMPTYLPTLRQLIAENPVATEDDIAWRLNEHMAVAGAKLLQPVYEQNERRCGYISIQTNAKYNRDAARMAEQAVYFNTLAPNIMVKIPLTAAGLEAIEEATYRGVNVNATVSFTVAQAVAMAQAVERALDRRAKDGLDNTDMHPVCTIMVGRIEDWLRETMQRDNIVVDPGVLDWSGVAVFKRAYQLYKQANYRTRLLVAAFRNHYHWSEFVGGDISMTIVHRWIKMFNHCDIPVESRIDNPVNPKILAQLTRHFPDFNRAYEPDGLTPREFDTFGATRRTLQQFLAGYDQMVATVRGVMIEA